MTAPDYANVVDKTVTLLSNNWNASNTGGDTPIIDHSEDIGKGRDLGVYDYVELSKTSPFTIDDADLTLTSEDFDVAVYCEIKSDTEDRRDDIFAEFRRILRANQKRPDCPANFDRIRFGDITPLDDSTFGAFTYQVTLLFEARSRTT